MLAGPQGAPFAPGHGGVPNPATWRRRLTALAADEQQRRRLPWILGALFALVLVRTAWICDDAYISLRTLDNFVHGFGLRWNVAERVQTFTHPLWLFLLTIPYFLTREAYYTSILLCLAASRTRRRGAGA